MKTTILYGKSNVEVDLPEQSVLIEPKNIDPLEDHVTAIRTALNNPIGSEALQDMVSANQTVSIVISDICGLF